jgi:hypothetical protein
MLQSHKNVYVSTVLIYLINDRDSCQLGSDKCAIPERLEKLS